MINTAPLNHESTSTVTIDAATAADIPELVHLLTSLFTLEHDFAPDDKRQHKGLELMITQPLQRIVMVARVRNHVVGMATAQLVVSTAQGGYSAWVEDVIVHHDYHRSGIGSALLNALTSWAQAAGATRMQLLCETANKQAISFYDTNGWHVTGLTCFRTLI